MSSCLAASVFILTLFLTCDCSIIAGIIVFVVDLQIGEAGAKDAPDFLFRSKDDVDVVTASDAEKARLEEIPAGDLVAIG